MLPVPFYGRDLPEIKKAGVLRHLGVPYASFVTGSGDGLDIELVQGFAAYIDVDYQFIRSNWSSIFGDLTGHHARRGVNGAEQLEETTVKGDIIANGMTILPWRQEVVSFSNPTFPSSVWLIARADSDLHPIQPSGSLEKDIAAVKESLDNHTTLALKSTCLDPDLYNMSATEAIIRFPEKNIQLNEMAPAILNHKAEATLLDVPDALIALEKWPGELKVIGPISDHQVMGAAFPQDSPKLLAAFNRYLLEIRADGSYNEMVKKYYPTVFSYFTDFFNDWNPDS
jgi:membrane-bound lytic murein transglycosylase MltF